MFTFGKIYGIIPALVLVASLVLTFGTNAYASDKNGGQDNDSNHKGWVTEEKHESANGELHECESHGQGSVCSERDNESKKDSDDHQKNCHEAEQVNQVTVAHEDHDSDKDDHINTVSNSQHVGGNPEITTTSAPAGSSPNSATLSTSTVKVDTLPDTGPETSSVLGLLGTLGLGTVLRFGSKAAAKLR